MAIAHVFGNTCGAMVHVYWNTSLYRIPSSPVIAVVETPTYFPIILEIETKTFFMESVFRLHYIQQYMIKRIIQTKGSSEKLIKCWVRVIKSYEEHIIG